MAFNGVYQECDISKTKVCYQYVLFIKLCLWVETYLIVEILEPFGLSDT